MSEIKLYLAILNNGWLRREMSAQVIPAMSSTKGVKLFWEDPKKTWANGISVNRNRIVKRFLQTDCDFLLMIDDDVVPWHNPAELVFADMDIIGSPARVRQNGNVVNWVAYIKHPDNDGYVGIDLSRVDSDIDLLDLKDGVVGTGCILIKRKVLEAIKAPFNCEYDEDGDCTFGTDFAFCRRAYEAGFKIWVSPWRICEHFKDGFGLNDMDAYDESEFHDDSPSRYKMVWSFMSIIQKDWKFIKSILVKNEIKTVLEFGSGLSSLLISEIAEVTSYETDRKYADDILSKRIVVAGGQTINNLLIRMWDGKDVDDDLPKYDLAFVDGPLGKSSGGMGREHSIRIAAEHADRIIIHDAGREDEWKWQMKILRPNFKRVSWNGAHRGHCAYWVRKNNEIS